jgi:hypothetical protein
VPAGRRDLLRSPSGEDGQIEQEEDEEHATGGELAAPPSDSPRDHVGTMAHVTGISLGEGQGHGVTVLMGAEILARWPSCGPGREKKGRVPRPGRMRLAVSWQAC